MANLSSSFNRLAGKGRGGLLAGLLALFLLAPGAQAASDFGWLEGATLVGLCGFKDRDQAALRISEAAAAGASVIDVHAGLTGDYETFMAPDSALTMISYLADQVHKHNRHVICYIAGLEIISHDLSHGHSALKDHPNWVQRNRDGDPALFDSKAAFWIPKGSEDIWVSPFAKDWLSHYLDVVAGLARSGVDGVYLDIPYWMTHFEGWGDTWASFDEATVAEFRKRTGLDPFKAKLGDFSDPVFQAWVRFRMDAIDEFVQKVRDTIRQVNPDVAFIVELYPGIGRETVIVGADPYRLIKYSDVITHEYNPFETSAMRGPRRWEYYQAGLAAMRAFERGRPSWMLTYAARDDWDGDKIAASANLAFSHLALGASFWECGGLRMCSSSVDPEWRSLALNWIREHADTFYTEGEVSRGGYGIYFSPATRTWVGDEYVNAFIGSSMLMMEAKRPYSVVTPRNLAGTRVRVLILPDVQVLTSDERGTLDSLAASGVTLVASGDLGTLDAEVKAVKPFRPASGQLVVIDGDPERDYLHGLALTEEWEEKRDPLPADSLGALANRWWAGIPTLDLEDAGLKADERGDVEVFNYERGDGSRRIQLFNTTGLVSGGNAEPEPIENFRLELPGTDFSSAKVLHAFGGEEALELSREDGHTVIVIPELGRGATVNVQ